MHNNHFVSMRTVVLSAAGLLLSSACSEARDGAGATTVPVFSGRIEGGTDVATPTNAATSGAASPEGETGSGEVPAGTDGPVSSSSETETTGPIDFQEPTAPDDATDTGETPPDDSTAPDDTPNADDTPNVDVSPPVDAAEPCEAIGWATRTARNGQAFTVTGGGDATPVVVNNFADLASLASDEQPRVIYVDGTVGGGWSGRTGDRLEVGSNKTIVGLRPGTELRAPIHVRDSSNVIVRNIVIQGPGSNADQAWDNINIEGASRNVWIDHCEFWNGQDGNADVVKGADTVTFTWNVFGYTNNGGHNFSNLVASSDNEPQSVGKLNITLMFNHFRGVAQRQPRCRFGNIHVVNNLFTRDGQASQNGISPGVQCRVLTENNHFIGIVQPIHERDGGVNELRGNNIFEGTTGNTTGFGGAAFNPPYDYADQLVPAQQVRALVEARAGATLESPTACDW